jgi:acyl-CoA synthetase (AMP-forming)/AMP-acid ligase II
VISGQVPDHPHGKHDKMNLFDYLTERTDPGKIALIEEGVTTTYGQLLRMADEVALTLNSDGSAYRRTVGILAENSAFWVASYLGIIKAGAVAAPLPSRLTVNELENYISLIGFDTVCIDDRLKPRYARQITGIRQILKSGIMSPTSQGDDENDVPGAIRSEAVEPEIDLASLMFTSGSTGSPNAVRVTHRNIMANTESIVSYLGLKDDDRMMAILPFHYCFGTSLLHTHLRAGASLVINNYFQYVEDVLNEMESLGCTGFAGVPSTYQTLLNNQSFRERSFTQLRHVQQAGGRLPDSSITELRKTLPPRVRIFIGYGQTEATARLSCLPPDMLGQKTGSIGRGIPGVRLDVVDHEGNPLRQGEVGEIIAEGENVTCGYLIPDPVNNPYRDGKLFTGDLAYEDEDGYIFIVGRAKEFIKPSGFKVMTATIELALLELPEIAEAAVTGEPHDQLGEAAVAWVVPKAGSELTAEGVIGHCRTKLPLYAVPCSVKFLDALPKNSSGKVMKRDLKTASRNLNPDRPNP